MWGKRIKRFLAIVWIVEGLLALLVPESMSKANRWFADFFDNPRNMRLGGLIPLAMGIWLALRQYQAEE